MRKFAIVYDWFDSWGGVERILLLLARTYPNAHFYTSFYNKQRATWAKQLKIHTSFMQKIPSWITCNRIASLPFFPFAFESFDFTGYDAVLSITSSFAKGVITRPETPHLCYLLTPTRFLHICPSIYIPNKFVKQILTPYSTYLKKWDVIASKRPDMIISLSKTVASRAQKHYDIATPVVYPPFDASYWTSLRPDTTTKQITSSLPPKYYLVVARLEKYKKIDVALEAFAGMSNKHLVIVGRNRNSTTLNLTSYPTVHHIPHVTDNTLSALYRNAQAHIMSQEEDFGYTSLEAQSLSCPVIALGHGGATETIRDGISGILFAHQNSSSLRKAVEKYDNLSYTVKAKMKHFAKKQACSFSSSHFLSSISHYLERIVEKKK